MNTGMGYIVLGTGTLDILAGASVSAHIAIGNGGVVYVEPGATALNTVVAAGGAQRRSRQRQRHHRQSGRRSAHYYGGGAMRFPPTVAAGGFQDVFWNGTVTDTILSGSQQVLKGGTAVHTVIEDGGKRYVG